MNRHFSAPRQPRAMVTRAPRISVLHPWHPWPSCPSCLPFSGPRTQVHLGVLVNVRCVCALITPSKFSNETSWGCDGAFRESTAGLGPYTTACRFRSDCGAYTIPGCSLDLAHLVCRARYRDIIVGGFEMYLGLVHCRDNPRPC
jgi:hypothetical protein